MRDLAVLVLYLLTIVRLAGPGGARLLVAESVLKELIEQDPSWLSYEDELSKLPG